MALGLQAGPCQRAWPGPRGRACCWAAARLWCPLWSAAGGQAKKLHTASESPTKGVPLEEVGLAVLPKVCILHVGYS